MSDDLQQGTEPARPALPLNEIKAKAKKFRWTAFAFILLCFVLPFVQVSCQQQKLMSFTGLQMAFGTEIQEPQIFGPTRTRRVPGDALLLFSFLAALAGLACSFIKSRRGSLITAICGAAGFLFMLIFKVRLDNEILKQSGGLLNVEYQFGFIAACLLFLMSAGLNSYLFYEERNNVTAPPTTPTDNGQRLDNLKSSATEFTEQTRQWFIKKDIPGWVRGHAILLGAIGGAVLLLFIVYYAFIKPSPTADGKRAALAYTNCQKAYKAKVDSAYQAFLNDFAAQNNQTRSSAEQKLESLLSGERKVYETCNEAADKLYNEMTARYTGDSEELAEFSRSFTENNGASKAAYEIEQSSSLLATVYDRIQAIKAPTPDSSRIVKDLVGRSMDGWNFSYASEFKEVKIINQKQDGDMLILRTHLNLEDSVTKEPYLAVLDLRYNLNPNGEWDYDDLTQLLHDKAEINYFIGNEIFLIGRWRWQGNYATYNPDGTWFGKFDDGRTPTGMWRIVRGNLVLTFNGRDWLNKKIVQFSKNELVIDETNPARAERAE